MDEKDLEKEERITRSHIDVDSSSNKVLTWFKKNIANIFLVGLTIFYVFNGAIKLVPNEMRLEEKIVYIFTSGIFGLVIVSLVGESGYTAGKNSEEFISTRDQAIECCEQALPYRKEAELYVSKEIDKDIRNERIEILSKASINYDEVFNADDIPYPLKQLKKEFNRKQVKAIKQAIKIKKIPFSLFGFTAVKSVGRKQAPNENKRRRSKFTTGFITKALIAIASGSVAVSYLGVSWSTIIYSLFQLALWFGSGLVTRISNYNFIVNVVREYDLDRIWYLKAFMELSEDERNKLTQEISVNEAEKSGVKRLTYNIEQKDIARENIKD